MKIDKKIRKIKDYTIKELEYIEELTGYPVEVEVVDKLRNGSDALTKVARGDIDRTHIYISEISIPYANHIILHECGHIRRVFSAPEELRKNLCTINTEEEIPFYKNVKRELDRQGCQEHQAEGLIHMFKDGIISMAFNIIPDARIENDIYSRYIENREEQEAYLTYISRVIEKTISPILKEKCPKTVFVTSAALNRFTLESVKRIIGTRVLCKIKEDKEVTSLYKKIKAIYEDEDKGYVQDIELTGKILDVIGVTDYKWIDFNITDEDYLERK